MTASWGLGWRGWGHKGVLEAVEAMTARWRRSGESELGTKSTD